MHRHSGRIIGLALGAIALAATSAGAQGKSQGKGHGQAAHAARVQDDGLYRNGANVPPGLAKKPGQMPPGQYKKRYGASEGADVLGGVLRRRGYSVLRVVPAGDSRYVYYRLNDGTQRRAIVSPGTDRLTFTNVPAALLQEVLARLY